MSMLGDMAKDYVLGLDEGKLRDLLGDMRGELSDGQLLVLSDVVAEEVGGRGLRVNTLVGR